MKKNLFNLLSTFAVLGVLLYSCSKKADYANVIPADASIVTAFNLQTMADKAGASDPANKEALQKLTDALKVGMNADASEQVQAIMEDPHLSGIDINSPVYFFKSPLFTMAIVAKTDSEDNLTALVEMMEKEGIATAIAEGEGYRYSILNKSALLAFTPTTVMLTDYSTRNAEKKMADIAALLQQPAEESITANAGFQKMQKNSSDIDFFASAAAMPHEYMSYVTSLYALDQAVLKDIYAIGHYSFEKGKINMKVETYTENPEVQAMYDRQTATMHPIRNSYLKYFPQSTIALFSAGIDGEKLFETIQANPAVQKEMTVEQANQLKQVLSIFKDDLTVGLINVTLTQMPTFLACAGTKDASALQTLYENKNKLKLRRGEDIIRLNDTEYVYRTRSVNVFYGVKNDLLYATNDELLYKEIGKEADPDANETDYAAGMKGKQVAMAINVKAICELPVMKMIAQLGGRESSVYLSLLEKVSHLTLTAEGQQSIITLQLEDKNTNALKQIADAARDVAAL